jgi:hypothetical protein
MGDIRVLLREAAHADGGDGEVEPDLDLVARRVHHRRRNRIRGRLAAGVLAVALVGGAAVAVDRLGDGSGDGVVAGPGRDTSTSRSRPGDGHGPGGPAGGTDGAADGAAEAAGSESEALGRRAAELTRRLADRSWLAAADLDWPAEPADFVRGPPEPGIIVVGTVVEVRPGPVTTSWCLDVPGCVRQTNVETVIRVDTVAPGDQAHPDELAVPWVTGQFGEADGPVDQATSDELAAPFLDGAPIGARVMVFLRPDDGRVYDWRPVEPSGIVIEDGDGVTVPRPDADMAAPTWTFDDYVEEVGRIR